MAAMKRSLGTGGVLRVRGRGWRRAALHRAAVLAAMMWVWLAAVPALAAGPVATPEVPAGAVVVAPGMDIQEVVDRHPPGTAYVLAPGLFRMQEVVPKDGDRFVGLPGARMNGALRLGAARRVGEFYEIDGARVHPGSMRHGVCRTDRPRCNVPLALFVGERPLVAVARLRDLVAGAWYLDEGSGLIHLAEDPGAQAVELTYSRFAFGGGARDVRIENLTIERYASANQHGAVNDGGRGTGWAIVNNEVRWNYGYGITLGGGGRAVGNDVHHNGQLGIGGGTSSDMLVEGNRIAFNAWNGTECDWECGGAKWGAVTGLVVRGNDVHDNAGTGLWTDEGCRDVTFEGNVVADNARAGISHEISSMAVIRGNVLRRNGSKRFVWGWDAQIQVQNSSDTLVVGNRVELDPELGGNGIILIQQDRGTGFEVRNVRVVGNEIVMPRARGVALGWFADFGAAAFTDQGNIFGPQRYSMAADGAQAAAWSANGLMNFADWRDIVGDRGSVFLPATP